MNSAQPNNPIAFVYLLKDKDERNKCTLTPNKLLVTRNGRINSIGIEEISSITFQHKFFLFPIVAGGSLGPFFFIALLSGVFHPAISMIGFILSMAMLYYGFSGKKSIRVETINDVFEFFLPYLSVNLKEFVSFVNELVTGKDTKEVFTFYMPLSQEQANLLQKHQEILLSEKGEYCLTAKRFHASPPSSNITFAKIHYEDPHTRIQFEKDHKGNLRPKIFGKITPDNESVISQ